MKQGKIKMKIFCISYLSVVVMFFNITHIANADTSQFRGASKQVGLAADFNRDGVIELTENKLFVFWINNDNDDINSETSGEDIRVILDPDTRTKFIDGTRDLIDFFAVGFDLYQYLTTTNIDNKKFFLQHDDAAVNIVYTEMSRGVSDESKPRASDYLKKINNSNVVPIFGSWQTNGSLLSVKVRTVTSEGIEIPKEFIQLIIDDENKGVILVEGNSETTKPLRLIVKDENNNIVADGELPISIYEVEDLFRQVSLRSGFFGTGRDEDSTTWGKNRVSAPDVASLLTDLTTQGNAIKLRMPEIDNTKHVIFVHGFKTNVNESKEYQLETFKRLFHSGSNALFTGVHWNGNEGFITGLTAGLNYWDNVENALYTADDFAALIDGMSSGTRTIIAHSLGNMMVGSAIQDFDMSYDHYFMVNPAVALEAYAGAEENPIQMRNTNWDEMYFGSDYDAAPNTTPETYTDQLGRRLWSAEWYQLFKGTGDARLSLTWRDRFKKVGDSTSVIQYFSSGDEVLKQAAVGDPNDLEALFNGGSNAWNIQEKGKGTNELVTIGGGSAAGWSFNESCTVILPLSEVNKPCRTLMHNEAQQYFDKTNIELIQEPFFGAFSNLDLLNLAVTPANAQAAVDKDYPRTLAYELPALSFAAGGTKIASFPGSRALNMNMDTVNGWPISRGGNNNIEWRHNDFREVAYRYTYRLFDSFVTEGALR